MNESIAATLASANSLARSTAAIGRDVASDRTTAFHATGPVIDQKRAVSVCEDERAALSLAPSLLTSSRSRAQISLVSAGGGAGRNCAADRIDHGFTCGHS